MEKIIVIAGPTGSGKTSLALKIASKINGELINADSRQVYKYFNIGTNKEPHSGHDLINGIHFSYFENGVKGWLFDFIDPDKEFALADYQDLAYRAISEVFKNNKTPIITGGTGLYIDAITKGYKIQASEPMPEFRKLWENKPLQEFYDLLAGKGFDYMSLNQSDRNNKRRLMRVYEKINNPNPVAKEKKQLFESIMIYPQIDRQDLYSQIDNRVDLMFKEGFVGEVESLISNGFVNTKPMKGIGYKEVTDFIQKKITLEECIQRVKQSHRNYARRQITWFEAPGRDYKLNIFDFSDLEKILQFLTNELN